MSNATARVEKHVTERLIAVTTAFLGVFLLIVGPRVIHTITDERKTR